MDSIRIQKWIAQLGIASRREAERWVLDGRLKVNGSPCILGTKIDPDCDQVSLDGKPLAKKNKPPKIYWLLHKPDGFLTSRVDGFQRPTIYDLPKLKKLPFLVSPVGRLDLRTEGLLLLTNDGDLANQLTHPRNKVPRYYHVLISGRLTKEEELKIARGELVLEDGPVKKADIRYAHRHALGGSSGSWYMLTVYEGRNRIVRRIFESLGYKVVRLIRVGLGNLRMPEDLMPGDYRQLTSDQLEQLRVASQNKEENQKSIKRKLM
jgi:23S rRNA pseudouridine2605 synthase